MKLTPAQKKMKRKIIVAAILLCCFAFCLAAAITGINGTWRAIVRLDGNDYTLNYTFKTEGDKVTGSSYQDQDEPKDINPGKISGSDFTFSISDRDGETFPLQGKYYAEGDSIALSIDYEGRKLHATLKRFGLQ